MDSEKCGNSLDRDEIEFPAVEMKEIEVDEVEIEQNSASGEIMEEAKCQRAQEEELVLRFGNWTALHILFLSWSICMSILAFFFYYANHHFKPTFFEEYYKPIFGYVMIISVLQGNFYVRPPKPSWYGAYKYPLCFVFGVSLFFVNRMVHGYFELIVPEGYLHSLCIVHGFYFFDFDLRYFNGGAFCFLIRGRYKGPFWLIVVLTAAYATFGVFGGYSKEPGNFHEELYWMYFCTLQQVIIVGFMLYEFCFKEFIDTFPWKLRPLRGLVLITIQWVLGPILAFIFLGLTFLVWPDIETVTYTDRFTHILFIGTYPLVPCLMLGIYTDFFRNIRLPLLVKGFIRIIPITCGCIFSYYFNHLFLFNMLEIFGDLHWTRQHELNMNLLTGLVALSLIMFCGNVWYLIPKEERDEYLKIMVIQRMVVPRFGWWTAFVAYMVAMIISICFTVIFFFNLDYNDFRYIVLPVSGYFFMFTVLHSHFWSDHLEINLIGSTRHLFNIWLSVALYYFNQAIFDALDYNLKTSQFHHLLIMGFVTRLSMLDVAFKGSVSSLVFVRYRHFKPFVWYFFGFTFSFIPMTFLSIHVDGNGVSLIPFKSPIGYIILALLIASTAVGFLFYRGIGPILMEKRPNFGLQLALVVVALLFGILLTAFFFIVTSYTLYFFGTSLEQRSWHTFNILTYLLPSYIAILFYTNRFKKILGLPMVDEELRCLKPALSFYIYMPSAGRKVIGDAKRIAKERYSFVEDFVDKYWPIHVVIEILLLIFVPLILAIATYFLMHLTFYHSKTETVGIGRGDWWESNDAIFTLFAASLMYGHYHYTNGYYFFIERE